MGQSLAGEFQPASRTVDVTFSRDADSLRLKLRWKGQRNDKALSMMWGKDGDEAFRRGGCFAACHNDMTDMPGNRGQQTGKYLWTSREQQQQIGRPAIVKDQAALAEMMEQGKFVVMWHVDLNSGTATTATLLDKLNWRAEPAFRASTSYENGWWQVDLRRSLHPPGQSSATLRPRRPIHLRHCHQRRRQCGWGALGFAAPDRSGPVAKTRTSRLSSAKWRDFVSSFSPCCSALYM